MDGVKEWVLTVATCAILAEVCALIMPDGQSRKTGMLVLGLGLVFCLILPVGNVYSDLRALDFSYETEQSRIADALGSYTEEQMLEVGKEYKERMTSYICGLVKEVEGIGDCQATFVMEEDYTLETYGTVQRIYVTAYPAAEEGASEDTRLDSGFTQMAPIERIEISLDGITVVPTEEEEREETDPRVESIRSVLQETFQLEKDCIFVEVKDA